MSPHPPPPQTLDTCQPGYRAVSSFFHESPLLHSRFWIHNFVFFLKKRIFFEFTLLHHDLSKLFRKLILRAEIKFHVIFFTKDKVVPLSFSFIFDQKSWLMNFMKMWKNLRVLFCFLQKNSHKMEFQVVILTFWTILIKHDEVE